jgi:hypothetical protein
MTNIQINGFTSNDGDRVWTADAAWGLVRNEDGSLTLLDVDGMPSNHTLTDDHAAHVVWTAGIGEGLMSRWDAFASAQS